MMLEWLALSYSGGGHENYQIEGMVVFLDRGGTETLYVSHVSGLIIQASGQFMLGVAVRWPSHRYDLERCAILTAHASGEVQGR